MSPMLWLPPDEFGGRAPPNLDLAADYLELQALFSPSEQCLVEDIADSLELSADNHSGDAGAADDDIVEDILDGAVTRISSRRHLLRCAYPFGMDDRGDVVSLLFDEPNVGQTAYMVSLILSNLPSLTPVLADPQVCPSRSEVKDLRRYFQYFATAAVAAEIGGPSWSFGFPRPDGTGFREKLSRIWSEIGDGKVKAASWAPRQPKDDGVDIFAWRKYEDGLPGFLLIAAQVATGAKWKDKSIKSHIARAFPQRWFDPAPVTEMIAYHVIPFARADDQFRDDVLVLGNVLHRLRVPLRVLEAERLAQPGVMIEAFDRLPAAAEWMKSFVARARSS